MPLPESTRELGELLGEARYYLVQGLIEDCQLALQVSIPSPPPESHLCQSPESVQHRLVLISFWETKGCGC